MKLTERNFHDGDPAFKASFFIKIPKIVIMTIKSEEVFFNR